MAFEVSGENWESTIAYLRAREQVTSVYLEKCKSITLIGSRRTVEAVTYVVDRAHRQYAGVLDDDALERHVRSGIGVSGHCTDYVMNTLAHLREMSIHDPALERLALRLVPQAASNSS
jgi:cation transport protein ChaC